VAAGIAYQVEVHNSVGVVRNSGSPAADNPVGNPVVVDRSCE